MTSNKTSAHTPQFKLKESDIQNLRTGLPVAYSGDFYPNIGRFIKAEATKASTKKSYTSFTKLVIASFGDGKSTLCRGIEHQWLGANLPVASIYIHNDVKLNNLHLNLIKALKTKDHDFFGLLLEVAKQRGSTSSNQIIRWAYNNHEQLSQIIDEPDLQEGFWEWFADEKIMKFNSYLSSKNIQRFVNKNNKNASRNFLYSFCNELTSIGKPPLLIIDELESILAFRNSQSRKAVKTQLREIIDETENNYSLIITSTLDFFRNLQADYAAVYNRLYNEPAKSASVTTWHLKQVRDENSMKDFFRLIKSSGADWKPISDDHTEQAISYFIPKGQAHTVELRSSVRDFINLLDESVADGDYRGFLLETEEAQPESEAEIKTETEQEKDTSKFSVMDRFRELRLASKFVTNKGSDADHEFDTPPSEQIDYDPLSRYLDNDEQPLNIEKTLTSTDTENQDKSTSDNTALEPIESLEVNSEPADTDKSGLDAAIELEVTEEASDTKTLKKDEGAVTKKAAHEVAFEKLVGRGYGHTIESFANRLTSMREIANLRIVTSETISTLTPQPELHYTQIRFTNDKHFGYKVALHSPKPDQHFLVIDRNREKLDSWYALTEQLLENNYGAKSISELRRLAYISMTMAGDAVDDVDIDKLVLSIANSMSSLVSESREGPLFLKPHRPLFNLGGRTQLATKQTRYMDALL